MRTYNYTDKWQKLLTPEIVGLLTAIHEYKGEQTAVPEMTVEYILGEIRAIQDNDAYHALLACDGLIVTGPTGTNVNDVAVALLKAK